MSGKSMTLANIQASLPTQAEIAQAQRRSSVLSRFSEDDVADILSALKKKALDGDVRAATIILNYAIGAPDQAPTTVNVIGATVNGPREPMVPLPNVIPKGLAKARIRIVELIALEGPMQAKAIAKRTSIRQDMVERCLDHDWFDDEQDGWHITNEARAEVLDGDSRS